MYELPETLSRAPKRLKVLEFIRAELRAGREFPSAEQVQQHMGWQQRGSAVECMRLMTGLDRVLKEEVAGGTWRKPRYRFSLRDQYR